MAQMPNVRKETQTILDLHHGVVESFHHHVKKLDQLTSVGGHYNMHVQWSGCLNWAGNGKALENERAWDTALSGEAHMV